MQCVSLHFVKWASNIIVNSCTLFSLTKNFEMRELIISPGYFATFAEKPRKILEYPLYTSEYFYFY